ncbi:hypothetical protein LCGC14_0896190 [marine sediment metagenome]|uniref:Uncharacterized protein n=1 Tax=marine sediment metagenome TaxID=412755 RepID=A0A0F9RH14_9ZZZZ
MTKAKAKKSDNISFRVPARVREAIDFGTEHTGESQSTFIITAVEDLVKKIDANVGINELMLPGDFTLPKEGSKMVTVRVDPTVPRMIQKYAPRLYHSMARLILWATLLRANKLFLEEKTTTE